LEGGVDWEKG
jgi:hypothetical protein